MKKMKFFGLLLALSLIFANFTQAQTSTTITRIAGGVTNPATASLCDNWICLAPFTYTSPGSHTFAMATSNVIHIVIGYYTGNFDLLRTTVDGAAGFYSISNGTNTLQIRRVVAGQYEFFII